MVEKASHKKTNKKNRFDLDSEDGWPGYAPIIRIIKSQNEEDMFDFFLYCNMTKSDENHKYYLKTNDPLIVWETINYCCSSPAERYARRHPRAYMYSVCLGREDHPRLVEYFKHPERLKWERWFEETLLKCPLTIPIPDWCQGPLGEYSKKITELSCDETIPPSKAIQKIPSIFGFQRPGWNIFSKAISAIKNHKIDLRFTELTYIDGVSKYAAYRIIAEEFGFEDTRSVQRIVASRKNW